MRSIVFENIDDHVDNHDWTDVLAAGSSDHYRTTSFTLSRTILRIWNVRVETG